MPIKYTCLLDIISFLNILLIHLSPNEENYSFTAQAFPHMFTCLNFEIFFVNFVTLGITILHFH